MKTILASLNAKYIHTNLAIRYLKEYCNEFRISIFESSINDNLSEAAFRIIDENPGLVGFSCYIWNIEMTLKICSIIKKVRPGIKILLGGPEVSYNGTHYLENYSYIDFLIEGEGEKPLKELLGELSKAKPSFAAVDGLVFRNDEDIVCNKKSELIQELDTIPFPYISDVPDKILYYEASRGCPFGCSYCLSGGARELRFFTAERVIRDLGKLIELKVELVKFVDRTFNSNKAFAMEIWRYLIHNGGSTRFHFELALDLIDEEMLELLRTAPKDLFQFEIGVQSTNLKVLKNINRIMNFDKIGENLLKIKAGGNIHCHVDLIAGLPGEGLSSFKNSFEACIKLMPDVLQLGFLKILKGTKLYNEREQYGIEYLPYPNYQVLFTGDMSFEDIRYLMNFEKVFDIYYNSGIYSRIISFLLNGYESKFNFFEEFTTYLKTTDFFIRNVDYRDKLKYLFQFGCTCFEENKIRDIMIHDFLINTKKSVLPDFLKRDINKDFKVDLILQRDKLMEEIGTSELKRIFYIPVTTRIYNNGGVYGYEQNACTAVFNLDNGAYCYF